MSRIKISFITPLYNCLEYTREYLDSLIETAPNSPYEIILVDDSSTDGTREFLRTLDDPPFRIFLNQRNLGFAKSSNRGASNAEGEFLCFLNNDVVLSSRWLEPMLELITSQPNVGAVGNIQLEPKTGLIHHAGVFFDWSGKPFHAWRYRQRKPKGEFGEWNAITAACFLIRKKIFYEFKGFDEDYINGFEDIDLCVRLRQKNLRLLASYRSIIEHHGSVSPGRTKYDDQNLELFLAKWQTVTRVWGKSEWPAQYIHRYSRAWWKMAPWRMAQAIFILAYRNLYADISR